MLHPLPPEAEGIPSPERFTYPFCYQPHPLCQLAAKEVIAHCYATPDMVPTEGKMFGVLIVEHEGQRYYLAAFSGIYNGSYHHDGFVPPICDLQHGYFSEEEQRIVALTHQINATTDETERIQLKALRKEKSNALQMWTFHQFRMRNARQEEKDLIEIFANVKSPFSEEEYIEYKEGRTPNKPQPKIGIPPGGTGECCAPKLLQYAYLHTLKPLCMAEFWVGPSKQNEMRIEGNFYPSCQHKCYPLLHYMMQGLDVEENPLMARSKEKLKQVRFIYEDDDILVVSKPAGLLSIPNRDHKEKSLSAYLHKLNPDYRLMHRLDMDTSGLMLVAKNPTATKSLQAQFERHDIKKKYVAILDEPLLSHTSYISHQQGTISLPLSRNPFDAPRQVVNYRVGKPAITHYVFKGENRVELFPETGRTHQLRIHCAHPDGLGRPIKGDILYGTRSDRLYLHAESITFRHPTTGEWMTFEDPAF
ncbi:MAG: RluA family pseudouridine synthase [Bacteroidaceae bacterium]|nr:RluA family pseudouridine synthase [Bacteroidaceae bacterium]